MRQVILGAFITLLLVSVGMFWWQGRAEVEKAAPPPEPIPVATETPDAALPEADVTGLTGPTPPEATELTREERRFFRYDRNRDRKITRLEMLSSRTDAFRRLDKDGNNLLTFEEWAVATVNRFEGADADNDNALTAEEFASTAPKRRKKKRPACSC